MMLFEKIRVQEIPSELVGWQLHANANPLAVDTFHAASHLLTQTKSAVLTGGMPHAL